MSSPDLTKWNLSTKGDHVNSYKSQNIFLSDTSKPAANI
jgi:hypothetical protein